MSAKTPRERSIILRTPEVRDILEGRKTQLRRIVKEQPASHEHIAWFTNIIGGPPGFAVARPMSSNARRLSCPYGQPGDRLWVREAFWARHDVEHGEYGTVYDHGPCLDLGSEHHPGIQYVATPENAARPDEPGEWWEAPPSDWDGESDYKGRGAMDWLPWEHYSKHPATHMPRWASRLTLEVVSVRAERLHDISEGDARAEGVEPKRGAGAAVIQAGPVHLSHVVGFRELWCSINGPESWDANPWVWVVEFRRVETPHV